VSRSQLKGGHVVADHGTICNQKRSKYFIAAQIARQADPQIDSASQSHAAQYTPKMRIPAALA
jgi:hypothetical protein